MDKDISARAHNRTVSTSPAGDIAFFITMMATAIALGGALAHAFELPNKIGLPRDTYLTVQQIYRGWNLLAVILLVELAGILWLIWLYRRERRVVQPLLYALAGLVAAQAVFWAFTYPANVATEQWTMLPENWEKHRFFWEYSHLVGALFQLIAFASLVVAVLRRRA